MKENIFSAESCGLWIDRDFLVREFEKTEFRPRKRNHTAFSKRYTHWLETKLWRAEYKNKNAPESAVTVHQQPQAGSEASPKPPCSCNSCPAHLCICEKPYTGFECNVFWKNMAASAVR